MPPDLRRPSAGTGGATAAQYTAAQPMAVAVARSRAQYHSRPDGVRPDAVCPTTALGHCRSRQQPAPAGPAARGPEAKMHQLHRRDDLRRQDGNGQGFVNTTLHA